MHFEDLGRIDPADAQALRDVLAGNLFEDGGGGNALGVDVEGKVYVTQQVAGEGLSFPRFIESFGRFVATAEHGASRLDARAGEFVAA